jgi:hypothetical protein
MPRFGDPGDEREAVDGRDATHPQGQHGEDERSLRVSGPAIHPQEYLQGDDEHELGGANPEVRVSCLRTFLECVPLLPALRTEVPGESIDIVAFRGFVFPAAFTSHGCLGCVESVFLRGSSDARSVRERGSGAP